MAQPLPGGCPPPNYGMPMRRKGTPAWFIAVTIVIGLLAAGVNLLFAFAMLFATDSCGTGAGTMPVCAAGVWLTVIALPWVGLFGSILVVVLGSIRQSRRNGPFWPVFLLSLAPYLLCCAIAVALLVA